MSVEYDYVNMRQKTRLELGKEFCVGAGAWSGIFNDFIELHECYAVNELIDIIRSPLTEHEKIRQQHTPDYALDWVFWDNYIARCAKAIHSYLCDDPMDYCVVSDNGISFVNKSFNGNDEMEDAIYEIRRNKDALVWTRYNN